MDNRTTHENYILENNYNPNIQENPGTQENPNWDTYLANSFNNLDIGDSVLRRRVDSAARGQNGNVFPYDQFDSTYDSNHGNSNIVNGQNLNGGLPEPGVFPYQYSSTYEESIRYQNMINGQNGFLGLPETTYSRNNRVNGVSTDGNGIFGPRFNRNGLYGPEEPMYVSNGSSLSHNELFGVDQSIFVGLSQNQDGPFGPELYLPNGPDLNQNGLYGLDQSSLYRNRLFGAEQSMYARSASSLNLNELFGVDQSMYVPNGLILNRNRLFGSELSMYVPNRRRSNRNRQLRPNQSMYVPHESNFSRNRLHGNDQSMYVPNRSGRARPGLRSRDNQLEHLYNENGLDRARPVNAGMSRRSIDGFGEDYSTMQLKDFKDSIKLMARNREYYSFVKRKIEDGAYEDIEMVFEEIKDDVASLMVNYFGSIVVQKLFKACKPEQITFMLRSLLRVKYQFVEICRDNHGSVAMEKLLENLSTHDQRTTFISALRDVVVKLSKEENSRKVVQYCIIHFPENVDVLINEIAKECYEIATHKSGCVVLQDCFGRATGETMDFLLQEFGPYPFLSEHPYGNYVVQYLLEMNNPRITENILSRIAGNYVSLSMNKCGSNVVEKCLTYSREDDAANIILELIESDNFLMVLHDSFGNYVVQKALEVCQNMRKKEIPKRLEDRIMNLRGSLDSNPYGKRIINKLRQFCPWRF